MSAGAIDLIYSDKIPSGTLQLMHLLKDSVCANSFIPFTGPIYDQDKELRCEEGSVMTPEDVIVMDWLAENVCGAIPTLDELKDEAVEVTAYYGITPDED